jgi:hypothetical protein
VYTEVRIERYLPRELTFPSRMGDRDLWALLPWRTKSFSTLWGRSSIRFTNRTFLGFSYGFRPGRSQHDALDALWVGIMRKKVSWVLDADIRDFFGSISHEWMGKFLQLRIADRRILRLIRKWLRAGVSEDGEWSKTEVGTPQGSVITPRTQKVTSVLTAC